MSNKSALVVKFSEVARDDIALVGGKGANLGEMFGSGFPVPDGFIVTSLAYRYFLVDNKLKERIKKIIKGLNVHHPVELNRVSQQIRMLINRTAVPEDLTREIIKSYLKLGNQVPVAVRSSATAEDLPDASFAGQQDTFLNVVGESNLVNKVRDAWSSLFTPRAIFYRELKKFDHFKVEIAVPVQKMIQSQVSGVMFTVNPVNNDKSIVVVEAIFGLGELIVQGSVTPDHYEVLKRTGKISEKNIARQTRMMVRTKKDSEADNVIRKVPAGKQTHQKLNDDLIVKIAEWGEKLQQHYFFPQDVEWSVENGKIYIIQTRPITTLNINQGNSLKSDGSATKGLELLIKGTPASPGLVSGPARLVRSAKEISKVKSGEVLITRMTTPDYVPAMKNVAAIVTDQGGQTSHAAIVSRELGVTAVVGTGNITGKVKNGTIITVNGKTGEIFRGGLIQNKSFDEATDKARPLPTNNELPEDLKTATKLYVNLAEPELAEKVGAENVDGVGLLRAEFMVAEIGVHPKKLINEGKSAEFVSKMAEGIEKFTAAFNPRPVVYRLTDFKTNEYRNLKGGDQFEPEEENPLIGYRGAGRYLADDRVFDLEMRAIKKVRSKYQNLHLMIPFVRSVRQLREVKKLIFSKGLRRGTNFKLWMMAELPVNVISIDEFIAEGIDGISIGTNDLTMLILGTDRDNQEVSESYDELNKSVLWALERLITASKRSGITSSICGQAPSLYPDLTEKLVVWGVTSISVSPDRLAATRRLIYDAENKLAKPTEQNAAD